MTEAKGERKDFIKANYSLVSLTYNRQYVRPHKVFDQVIAWDSVE